MRFVFRAGFMSTGSGARDWTRRSTLRRPCKSQSASNPSHANGTCRTSCPTLQDGVMALDLSRRRRFAGSWRLRDVAFAVVAQPTNLGVLLPRDHLEVTGVLRANPGCELPPLQRMRRLTRTHRVVKVHRAVAARRDGLVGVVEHPYSSCKLRGPHSSTTSLRGAEH